MNNSILIIYAILAIINFFVFYEYLAKRISIVDDFDRFCCCSASFALAIIHPIIWPTYILYKLIRPTLKRLET